MSVLERERCEELVARCVELARADEVRVSVAQDDAAHLRFARNSPTTSGIAETVTLAVTATFGARSGTARGNQLDPPSVEALVRRAEALARRSPEDPEHVPALGPQEYAAVDAAPREDLELRLARMAAGAGRAIEDARAAGLVVAGFVEATDGARAIGTSAGLFGYQRVGSATYSQTVRTKDGTGSGWASRAGREVGELDFAGASATAIEKAVRSRGPTALEPGDHPAILEPDCVASLLGLLLRAMDRRSAEEGRSAFAAPGGATRLGESAFPELVDVRSDPADPELGVVPWDGEGLPHRPTTWVDRGRVASLATSRYWALARGTAPLPRAPNARMAGGAKDLAALIAGTERAVLVTNLWYIRSVDPRTLLHTGLTRDGVFLVEDGRIARPLTNFRWNDSPLRAFRNAVELSTPTRVGGRGGRAEDLVVPAMRVSAFGFASVSEAV